MEKRVLLAIFLSFVVLYVYQSLVPHPVPRGGAAPGARGTQSAASPAAGSRTGASPPAASGQASSGPDTAAGRPMAAPLIAGTERGVRVETRDVVAIFTTRGARLRSWRLKRFLDDRKEPQELVTTALGDRAPLPFSLKVPDEAVTATLNQAVYAVSGDPAGGAPDPDHV